MRVCGLKQFSDGVYIINKNVAPRAGVWIETKYKSYVTYPLVVAPRAGVWIETSRSFIVDRRCRSHPVRVCGLKHFLLLIYILYQIVAPRAGVWIETCLLIDRRYDGAVAPRAGVWIETEQPFCFL